MSIKSFCPECDTNSSFVNNDILEYLKYSNEISYYKALGKAYQNSIEEETGKILGEYVGKKDSSDTLEKRVLKKFLNSKKTLNYDDIIYAIAEEHFVGLEVLDKNSFIKGFFAATKYLEEDNEQSDCDH